MKKPLNITLDEDIIESLKTAADRRTRSVSYVVNELLRQEFPEEEAEGKTSGRKSV